MSDFFSKTFTFDRVIRIGISISIIIGLIWLMAYLSDVLFPFAIAAIIAYLLNPVVDFFQYKLKFKYRILAVITTLILFFALLVAAGIIIIPIIIEEFNHLSHLIYQTAHDQQWDQKASEFIPPGLWEQIKAPLAHENVQEFVESDNFAKITSFFVKKLLPGIWGVFSGAIQLILGFLVVAIVLLYLIFIMIDYKKLVHQWKDLIPNKHKNFLVGLVYDFRDAMQNYFRAQALIAFIVGILFSVGFYIIGLPMGIILGLFIGLLNMVPYLQNIALIPATLLALLHSLETDMSFGTMLILVALVFIIIQVIQDAFLTPKIMGKATGLNPAIILLSLSVWGKLLGLLGLLIALPMTYLIYSYYKRFILIKKPDNNT